MSMMRVTRYMLQQHSPGVKKFEQVIIITCNKKDYNYWNFVKFWTRVLTLREFYVNYLKSLFRRGPLQHCPACADGNLNDATRAMLLYLDELGYLVVDRYLDGTLELETYCYVVF